MGLIEQASRERQRPEFFQLPRCGWREDGKADGEVGVVETREAALQCRNGRDSRQALLNVAAVGLEMNLNKSLQQDPPGSDQVSAHFEVVGEAHRLIQRPGLECGHELTLVNHAVLQREQSKQ